MTTTKAYSKNDVQHLRNYFEPMGARLKHQTNNSKMFAFTKFTANALLIEIRTPKRGDFQWQLSRRRKNDYKSM